MTEGITQPLVLIRTGGIGGVADRLELRPDGSYTVTSKGKAPVTRQLGEGQLAAIVDDGAGGRPAHTGTTGHRPSGAATSSPTCSARRASRNDHRDHRAGRCVRPLLEELDALFSSPGSTP